MISRDNEYTLNPGQSLQGGKYVIEHVLGTGGFGITYYARHTSLKQYYAIKEFFIDGRCVRNTRAHTISLQGITPETFEKYRLKFMEEAQTLVHLDHPNIVKVIDVFEENSTSYIVMPFISGSTLDKIVQNKGPLDYASAVNYLGQIADAIGYIHKRNILHRDVKPDNIIITPENKAILIDFGSAREFIQDKTQHQTSILTKGYAPIEQYSSTSRKGAYTDIYALGAVFYYVITGTVPMDAATRLTDSMLEPKELISGVNADANRTIMKAMQLKHENRHQTIDEFMEDLLGKKPSDLIDEAKILEGRSTTAKRQTKQAPPPPPLPSEKKKSKVIIPIIIIVLAVITMLAIGAGLFLSGVFDSSKSENLADAPIDTIYVSNDSIFDEEGCLEGFYTGQKFDGKMNGRGTFRSQKGTVRIGEFVDDEFVKGSMETENHYRFEGEAQNNQPYNGTWYDPDGKFNSEVINGVEQ